MRVAIVSDIHANAHALDAVRQHARQQAVDAYWFLGDGVGYGPHPIEALEFWQNLPPGSSVPGNHDAGMVGALTQEGFNERALEALAANRATLSDQRPGLLQWLYDAFPGPADWVVRQRIRCDRYVMVHGSLWNQAGPREHLMLYVKPWLRTLIIQELSLLVAEDPEPAGRACLLSGHTHIPNFCYLDGLSNGESEVIYPAVTLGEPLPLPAGPTLINPGSVGQPRDRDWRASYAVLDAEAATITFHRLEYPVEQTQRDMRRLGFHQFQRERLKRAYAPEDWPPGWRV